VGSHNKRERERKHMDFFTIVIILSVVVGVGVIGYALFFGKKEEDINLDAGDVTLMSAGIQDPTLGVAAYTAGKASQRHKRVGCCGDGCDCGTGIDVDDAFATAMVTSTTEDPPSDSEFIIEEPEPPVAHSHASILQAEDLTPNPVFHHVDLGKTEEPSPTVEESGPSWADTPASSSSFSHAEYGKSDSPPESVSTISEPPSSSSSDSNNNSGNSGD
jgi:hypothetical protein